MNENCSHSACAKHLSFIQTRADFTSSNYDELIQFSQPSKQVHFIFGSQTEDSSSWRTRTKRDSEGCSAHLTVLNITRTSVLQYYKQVLSCELNVPFMGQSDYEKQHGHHISQHTDCLMVYVVKFRFVTHLVSRKGLFVYNWRFQWLGFHKNWLHQVLTVLLALLGFFLQPCPLGANSQWVQRWRQAQLKKKTVDMHIIASWPQY